jgi:hypothetical protein
MLSEESRMRTSGNDWEMFMKMLREPAVLDRMGMGKTSFNTKYIKTGRARWVRDRRIKRMPEHEVDRLIAEDIAARDTWPREPPKPALPRDAYLKGAHRGRGRAKATTPNRGDPVIDSDRRD